MRPEEFHPDKFERGRKYEFDLELGGAAEGIVLPVLLARGQKPGKTLVVTAGVHGDEYEGVRAIFEVYSQLNPAEMTGDFLSVPVANPPAFWNGTRSSPLDNGNLARVFPGDRQKGATWAIASYLGPLVIAHADLYVDLHSAGVRGLMPSMIGYYSNDPRSRDAAAAFGAKVMWGHPNMTIGRTVTFAYDHNIPWLYTEARGAGRIDPEDLEMFVNGTLNMLRHLGIIAGKPVTGKVEYHLFGDGDIDKGLSATQRGFFVPHVRLLESVKTGQELGDLRNLHGKRIEAYTSPCDGLVAYLHQFPVVEAGDHLFVVTGIMGENEANGTR